MSQSGPSPTNAEVDPRSILSWGSSAWLPIRISAVQAAAILGCPTAQVHPLIAKGLACRAASAATWPQTDIRGHPAHDPVVLVTSDAGQAFVAVCGWHLDVDERDVGPVQRDHPDEGRLVSRNSARPRGNDHTSRHPFANAATAVGTHGVPKRPFVERERAALAWPRASWSGLVVLQAMDASTTSGPGRSSQAGRDLPLLAATDGFGSSGLWVDESSARTRLVRRLVMSFVVP